MRSTARFLVISLIVGSAVYSLSAAAETVESVIAATAPLTPEAINSAPLIEVDTIVTGGTPATPSGSGEEGQKVVTPFASIVRLQILLDRAGASPGVIDGLDGGNLRKAIKGFQLLRGLPVDGKVNEGVASALESPNQVIGSYVITGDDGAAVVGNLPEDYSELAKLD